MHKFSRTLLVAGVMAFGTLAAACGDKVTVTNPPPGQTGVTNISVTPPAATINTGATIQLAVSVTTADGATAKTVTWTTSNSAVATVDQTGKVTGVAAGTASIIATSTADASKSAAAAITVQTTTSTVTPAGIAISSVTAGGLNAPVNLANVANQIDVTTFVSGPAGTVKLIQNCTAAGATSSTGDVVVAQQSFAGSQNQTPITLSYNTAATGTITGGVATVDNTVSTPIQVNGNCFLKAQLVTSTGTVAAAANITPFTLNNANFFRSSVSFTKTTPAALSAAQNAISAANGLRYDQGDLVVSITPVVYTTAVGSTTAQVPALATITFSGNGVQGAGQPSPAAAPKVFTNVALTGGKFTVTFPSTGASAQNINEYTSNPAGDNITITGYNDAAGQPITVGFNTANATCVNAINCTVTPIRVDNQSPQLTVSPFGTAGVGALAQNMQLFTTQRNYVNAAYSFSANNTPQADNAFAQSQLTTSYYVGALPATATTANAPALTTQSNSETASACSITGLTKVATGADVARILGQTPLPGAPNYFVRVIESDPLGNSVCQDFGVGGGGAFPLIAGFGVDTATPVSFVVTGGTNGAATNASVITTGALNTFNAVDSLSGFNQGAELRAKVRRNWINNTAGSCVIGTFSATSSTCNQNAQAFAGITIDNNTGTQGYYVLDAVAQDQAGNQSAPIQRVYLIDNTPPTIGGVSIPQTLVGGSSVTFLSAVSDNVDLSSSNFSLLYSAISGSPSLYYSADNYGPTFDSTRVTSANLNATVPFFIKQMQGTAGAACPNGATGTQITGTCGTVTAFAVGDSGRAASVTVRAIDAAGIQSTAPAAAIPVTNITSSSGFGTTINEFGVNNAQVTLSNGNGTGTRSVALTAQAQYSGANPQQQNVPFSQVCFYYQNNVAQSAAQPIPLNDLVQIGCVNAPAITDAAGVSRNWTYTLSPNWDPPAYLGTAGNTVNIFAVGINSNGVGIISQANPVVVLNP